MKSLRHLLLFLPFLSFACQTNSAEVDRDQMAVNESEPARSAVAYDQTESTVSERSAQRGPTRRVALTDPQNGNMPAYYFTLPDGYQLQGKVYWQTQDGITRPNFTAEVYHRGKKTSIYVMPAQHYTYMTGPSFNQVAQYQSSSSFRQVMHPTDALRQMILPALENRHGRVQLKNCESVNASSLYKSSETGQSGRDFPGGKMTLTFEKNGESHRSEVYAFQSTMVQEYPSMYGTDQYIYWSLFGISELSAPTGAFSQVEPELRSILQSFEVNPEWQAIVKEIDRRKAAEIDRRTSQSARNHNERMRQMQQNFDAHQNAMRTRQEAFDNSNRSWQQNQNIQDASHSNYIDGIYGRENYTDPNTGDAYQLEQPNQYNWTDGQGTVISTDDALYDPNIGSTQEYNQLEPE